MDYQNDEDEALKKAMELSLAESHVKSQSGTQKKSSQEELDHAEALRAIEEAETENPEYFQEKKDQEWEEEMVPVPVNQDLLNQLLEMEIPDVRARKAIVHGGSIEGALNWLSEHENDPDLDQPYLVRKSDTIPKPPLTEEEKAKKIEDMKNKIKQRREERAKLEKAEEIKREKERRERGQKIDETMEERQRNLRKLEADKIKREKAEANKERERLRAEIARDKEIRRLNKGVLPSVLGVEGYNPSAVQYDVPTGHAPATHSELPAKRASDEVTKASAPTTSTSPTVPTPAPKKSTPNPPVAQDISPEAKIDQSIATIMRYRTGGDGGQALKLLVTFIKNIVEHPEDPKYLSINTESNAFKTKLVPLVGTVAILKTVGFEKDETDGKLKYQK